MNIGQYIKSLRTEKGLTQEELGAVVGVQRAAVQKWESGAVQNLKRTTIQKLSEYFDVSPASFINIDNDNLKIIGLSDYISPENKDAANMLYNCQQYLGEDIIFATNLIVARIKSGCMDIETAAGLLGVEPDELRSWEKGEKMPPENYLKTICQVYKIDDFAEMFTLNKEVITKHRIFEYILNEFGYTLRRHSDTFTIFYKNSETELSKEDIDTLYNKMAEYLKFCLNESLTKKRNPDA